MGKIVERGSVRVTTVFPVNFAGNPVDQQNSVTNSDIEGTYSLFNVESEGKNLSWMVSTMYVCRWTPC